MKGEKRFLLGHSLEGHVVSTPTHEPSPHLFGVIPGHPGSTGQSRLVAAQEPSQQLQLLQESDGQSDGTETQESSLHRKGELGGQEGIEQSTMESTQVSSGHRTGQVMPPPVVETIPPVVAVEAVAVAAVVPVVPVVAVVPVVPVVAVVVMIGAPEEKIHKSLR